MFSNSHTRQINKSAQSKLSWSWIRPGCLKKWRLWFYEICCGELVLKPLSKLHELFCHDTCILGNTLWFSVFYWFDILVFYLASLCFLSTTPTCSQSPVSSTVSYTLLPLLYTTSTTSADHCVLSPVCSSCNS